ncbi:TetR family transcriptional regulator [Anaerocolumna cellulosilytica]|uniref:TetR family transcriptional regulator n=1 Tax=Anaerocolumna cellulosilytica TaxID=433286 RepID=A0A6S6R099_9FIRM|nr:TetR/AcrR family transcriptional regulator [Anaerocolumna cellulosilytica]MBB5195682.1 AcrR family transcriptional regulator [Anaerocolumna cellulosilytica]BCJ92982.1 TetR family transcriptional regulator [Anaerocolumna cellulosilytica]
MKTKRQIQKESTKIKISNAAYNVYSEYGFSATTAMIAKEAGVSHGTIFVHFPSVNELLIHLIEIFGNRLALEMHNLSKKNDAIETLLIAYIDVLKKYESFYIRLISERCLLPEDVQMIFVNIQSSIAVHFNEVIVTKIENQMIKNLPVHLLFNTWMGLLHYYLLNKDLFSPEESLLERYDSELITTFLELIKN